MERGKFGSKLLSYVGAAILTPYWAIAPCIAQSNLPSPPLGVSSPTFAPSGPCGSFYPQQIAPPKDKRITRVNVHILTDGTITNTSVNQSSGDPLLDAAAIACVKSFKPAPVKSGGQPVEIDWQYDAVWNRNGYSFAMKSASPFCPAATTYPVSAVRKNEQGAVAFTYSLGTDGKAANLQVTQSSGFPDLDKAVIDCVTGKTYPIATQAGKPVPIDMEYRIVFHMSG